MRAGVRAGGWGGLGGAERCGRCGGWVCVELN